MTFPILMLSHWPFCVFYTDLICVDRELLPGNNTLKEDWVSPVFLSGGSLGFARAAMQLEVGK